MAALRGLLTEHFGFDLPEVEHDSSCGSRVDLNVKCVSRATRVGLAVGEIDIGCARGSCNRLTCVDAGWNIILAWRSENLMGRKRKWKQDRSRYLQKQALSAAQHQSRFTIRLLGKHVINEAVPSVVNADE